MRTLLVATALVASIGTISASPIVFFDNFSGAPGTGVNDDTTTGSVIYTGSPYTLTAGSIDVNSGTFYGWLCDSGTLDSGNCLDTTGSGADGTIQATVTFPSAGEYVLTVDLQGWDDTVNGGGGQTTTVMITLNGGTLGSSLYSSSNFRDGTGGNDTYPLITATFNVSGPGTSLLTFQDTGVNQSAAFAGAILDAAQISAAPEPATFVLAGAALLALAGLRKRS